DLMYLVCFDTCLVRFDTCSGACGGDDSFRLLQAPWRPSKTSRISLVRLLSLRPRALWQPSRDPTWQISPAKGTAACRHAIRRSWWHVRSGHLTGSHRRPCRRGTPFGNLPVRGRTARSPSPTTTRYAQRSTAEPAARNAHSL